MLESELFALLQRTSDAAFSVTEEGEITRSGQRVWINMSTLVFDNQRTGRRLLIHLAHDVTEQKKSEELVHKVLDLSKQLSSVGEASVHGGADRYSPPVAHTARRKRSRVPPSSHIWKEDYLLFPMANKLLNDSEQGELLAQFERHDSEIGIDVHHGFERLAGRILEMICAGAGTCHAA